MIKGISRRVVVVQPGNREVFDEAIFLVRDCPQASREVVQEACRIAERYVQSTPRPVRGRLRQAGIFCAGAALTGAIWVLCTIL